MSGGPKIDREPTRTILIRELALAEATQTVLAHRHGVDQSTVSSFARRHAGRIETVRAKLDDQFADQVYATKAARVAVLGQQVDDAARLIDDALDVAAALRTTAGDPVADVCALMRAQAAALRAIADELGQIPARVQVEHSGGLDVRINGVNVDDLT